MPRQVGFQGEPGAFGEEAIAALWPNDADPVPLPTFADVVRAVAGGQVDVGVLPVENSIAGTVQESVDALRTSAAIQVVGETTMRITQCLMAPEGASMETLATVESHPVALAQCRAFLSRYAWITAVPVSDTAGAARDVAVARDSSRGAIAGRRAALRYGLAILAEGIEDDSASHTRFIVIAPATNGSRPHCQSLSKPWRRFHAVRGATTVEADDPQLIRAATRELLLAILDRNDVQEDQVVSVLFSATADLTSDFPARAARDLGWLDTPLMCMTEIPVRGALERCIRVMLHIERQQPRARIVPVYLRGAEVLRRDLCEALDQMTEMD
jgi:monofunctional chorismate mutase